MQNERAVKPHISQPLSLFKSKRVRNIIYLIIVLLSVPVMLCADTTNDIRTHYLPFLNNFIGVIKQFNIRRYDITASTWILFTVLFLIALTFIIGNIIAPNFVKKKTEKNSGLFKFKSNTRLFYATLFYGALILIDVVIIVVLILTGAFSHFGKPVEKVSPFSSLLTMLKNYVIVLVILSLILFIVYMAVRIVAIAIIGINRLKNPQNYAENEEETEPEQAVVTPAPVIETAAAVEEAESEQAAPTETSASETAEPVAESETVSEPSEELIKIKVTDEAETEPNVELRKSIQKSFSGKMSQATNEQKEFYNELKNYLLSFKRVNSRVSWHFDSFNIGRAKAVKLAFRGQTMVAYLALNPKDYEGTKYYPHDMSDKKKFEETPMMVKIKSERGVKFAKELIDVICKDLPAKKNFVAENYKFTKMSDAKLIENGLAKEVYISTPPKKS